MSVQKPWTSAMTGMPASTRSRNVRRRRSTSFFIRVQGKMVTHKSPTDPIIAVGTALVVLIPFLRKLITDKAQTPPAETAGDCLPRRSVVEEGRSRHLNAALPRQR